MLNDIDCTRKGNLSGNGLAKRKQGLESFSDESDRRGRMQAQKTGMLHGPPLAREETHPVARLLKDLARQQTLSPCVRREKAKHPVKDIIEGKFEPHLDHGNPSRRLTTASFFGAEGRG